MSEAGTVLLITILVTTSLVAGQSRTRNASSPNSQQVSSTKGDHMKLNIKIGGKILTATLADNATAQDFVSVLPLKVSMNDLLGREKYANLPKTLSEKGPRTKRYEVGEMAYWSPSHDLAIYYRQDGESIPSPGIIPIAKIDAGTEAFKVPGSVKVTIEFAK
jgi:hypothetical protein